MHIFKKDAFKVKRMVEIKTLKELADYELIDSFKHRSFFGLYFYHYLYKGKTYTVHISWCNTGIKTSWIVSYGKGDVLNYKDIDCIYEGYEKVSAIKKAKGKLDETVV